MYYQTYSINFQAEKYLLLIWMSSTCNDISNLKALICIEACWQIVIMVMCMMLNSDFNFVIGSIVCVGVIQIIVLMLLLLSPCLVRFCFIAIVSKSRKQLSFLCDPYTHFMIRCVKEQYVIGYNFKAVACYVWSDHQQWEFIAELHY